MAPRSSVMRSAEARGGGGGGDVVMRMGTQPAKQVKIDVGAVFN